MRFRDPNVIPLLAKAILETLKLPDDHSPDMEKYRTKVLYCQCRELEKFLRLRKSVAAQRRADELGIGDLSRFVWDDQNKKSKMRDINRGIFHFEHTMPVAMMVKMLMSLTEPTIDNVASVIGLAEVSWITKDEDKQLTSLKLGHRRDDPEKAYAAAKIILCPE